MTLSRASLAGVLFALMMCTWVYIDRGPGFDELAIRFAAYFVAFTLGFWALYNFVLRKESSKDDL